MRQLIVGQLIGHYIDDIWFLTVGSTNDLDEEQKWQESFHYCFIVASGLGDRVLLKFIIDNSWSLADYT